MFRTAITKIQLLVDGGHFSEAEKASHTLVTHYPECVEGWMLLTLCAQRLRHFSLMCSAAREAAQLHTRNVSLGFKYIEALLFCGRGAQARKELKQLESANYHDARCQSRIAELYTEAGEHRDRLRCAQRALVLLPGHRHALANLAAAETACGLMKEAELHLDELLQRYPQDHGARYRRSVLRRQTTDDNHIAELEQQLQSVAPDSTDMVPLCFALAKECEDLEMHEPAFAYLERGADQRRRQMVYQVDEDERAIDAIISTFSRAMLGAPVESSANASAIFVMGLPRSGTTLVDRILSSHSQVQSLGEINDLAYTMVRLAHEDSSHALDKVELISKSAMLNFRRLGDDYAASTFEYGLKKPLFIDKTPWNFLYLGLIAKALPNAKVIHVRRHPVDSCFALYKTLFRGGSPYSYDLNDLARYYIAYHRLMAHWRDCLPGQFVDVQYEQLVKSQRSVTGEMLAYCGLQFEESCLQFHRNPEPAATASAAQVREPIHARSVSGWKKYSIQLSPLVQALGNAGINVD